MLVLNELTDICPLKFCSKQVSISFRTDCLSKPPDCVDIGKFNVILLSLKMNAYTENARTAITTNIITNDFVIKLAF